jgi:pilus assembly protein CpaE
LIDASLQFGDADVLLNLQGHGSIADAAARISELDSDLLNAMMTPHPSGIKVLAAPATPEQSETINGDEIKAILEIARKDFDYVLMDSWSLLDEVVLSAMDLADRILLVLTPEIPAIRSTKQFFEVAEALQFPLDRIDLILNKVIPRDGIRPEQLEGSIKHKILAQLDLDPRSIRQATNQGMPLLLADANHPLAKSFLDLAQTEVNILEPQPEEQVEEEATPQPQERRRRAGLFGRLRK